MELTKKLDICLGHLHDLIVSFEEAKEANRLTGDFFSDSLEHLEQVREIITEMDQPAKKAILLTKEETKESTPVLLEDKIVKVIFPNFRKAISLNDHFRFQRDLFNGDASLMDQTISMIDDAKTYGEAVDSLKKQFDWDWSSESVMAFDELLCKRFL